MSDSRLNIRKEITNFATAMETRLQSEEERGRTKVLDKPHLLSRMFDMIHEIKDAVNSGRDPSVYAADLACSAMQIIETCGKLSTASLAVRRGSMRTMDATKDTLKDSSSKYAILSSGKCVLWGADLKTDFEITDDSLLPVIPAICVAMKTLHAYGMRVDKIVVRDHLVYVYTDEGSTDPRTDKERIPIPDI